MTPLTEPEDIAWLRQVHCPKMPATIRFAILYGNEDCPECVEAWDDANPDYDQKPDFVYRRDNR